MSQLFKPYSPYTYLKQTFCSALHQNKVYKLEETERQNKDSKSPQDAVKLYMCLKKHGEIEFEYTCSASSLKKGRIKLALGILRQKYGFEKRWKELVREMTQAILDAREKRGAGEKPFLQKYDAEMVHKDDGILNGHDMVHVEKVIETRELKT